MSNLDRPPSASVGYLLKAILALGFYSEQGSLTLSLNLCGMFWHIFPKVTLIGVLPMTFAYSVTRAWNC